MQENKSHLWKLPNVVQTYLSGTRLAFPGAFEQIEVMLKLIRENSKPLKTFLDIGCGDGLLGAAILERFPDSNGVFLDFSAICYKLQKKSSSDSVIDSI